MPADNSPRWTSLSVWLFGLLALGSAAVLGLPRALESPRPTAATPERPRDDRPAATTAEADGHDPLIVLREQFRVAPAASSRDSAFTLRLTGEASGRTASVSLETKAPAASRHANLAECLSLEPAQYEFLIATVPDPVDSKFALEFDAVVDGIQRAFEAREFSLRSSWLPWPRGQGGETRTASKSTRIHREYPGTLLLRKRRTETDLANGEPPTLALVCLVGESPIRGINKPAFTRALGLRDELDAALKKSQPKKAGSPQWAGLARDSIPVVGPYFSGSQASLDLVLAQWQSKGNRLPLRLISGNATALRLTLFSTDELRKTTRTTVIPNELLTRAVLSYLAGYRGTDLDGNSKGRVRHRVAILREANTVFGVGARECELPVEEEVIDLPFPLSISQLQVDADKEQRPAPGAGLPRTDFVEPHLQVRTEPQPGLPEPYDRPSAATTAGQSLRSIMTTITRARVRYVGIVATDNRDVVYLNQLIRKQCPEVRVFTTEPSIAFTHPDDAYYLRGMVVASTYPMHVVTQNWTRRNENQTTLISFPTQGSEGYYNAVLAHFQASDQMLDYCPPRLPGIKGGRPPIWISVIGQGGRLVPVHCYTQYSEGDNRRAPPLVAVPGLAEKPPAVAVSVGVLLGSVGAIGVLSLVILTLAVPRLWQKWVAGPTEGHCDNGWIWMCRGIMLAGVLFFALPYSLPAREICLWDACCDAQTWRQWFVLVGALAVVLEVLVIVGLLVFPVRNLGWGRRALAALVLLAAGFAWTWWGFQTPVVRFFVYVRATELSAGLSPLVPMGLMAAAAFAVGLCCLWQADAARQSWLSCPYSAPWKGIQQADEELRSDLGNLLRFVRTWYRPWLILTLGVSFLLGAFWNIVVLPLPSGEGPCWDTAILAVFWVLAGAVILILAWFLALWSRLGHLLEEILRVPMVGAFERLPEEIARLFSRYLYSHHPNDRELTVVAWCLPEREREELAKEIECNHPQLAWVFGKPLPPGVVAPGEERSDRTWLIDWLNKRASAFLEELPGNWTRQTVNEAFGIARPDDTSEKGEKKKEPADTSADEDRRPAQEQFVAAFVVMYLGRYFAQMRLLVYALVTAAPLLLLASASYQFQPDRPRLNALVALVIAVVAGTLYVLCRINRDGLASRITRTTPHRLTPDSGFLSSVTVYVLPVVAILLAQVFGLFRFILEPILGLFQ
jgi:hypothetical protein